MAVANEAETFPTLAASVVSIVSQSKSQPASSAAVSCESIDAETMTLVPADGKTDSDEEEVTTAEFSMDLTDNQTWAINFYECAAEGDVECLEEILESGHVDVNDVDVDGFTALMVAAAEGHCDVVRALLRRGANVSLQTHELRSTALHFAAKNGDGELIAALCACDATVVDSWNINADTPLIWACIEGQAEAVKVLLEHGANVDVLNQYGASPLLCAVMIGEEPEEDAVSDAQRAKIVTMLVEKNRNLVNLQDQEGSTAMHLAASCGYLECVKTLLTLGADLTLRNGMGKTPLEEAQDSQVRESLVCVEYLRGIWRQLEEEAASRMMAMLEMEEEADKQVTSNGISSKKHRKKNKKAKRKAGKQHQQQHEVELDANFERQKATDVAIELAGVSDLDTMAQTTHIAQEDNESCASSDEERVSMDQAQSVSFNQNSDEEDNEMTAVCEDAQETSGGPKEDVDSMASTDVWTTVGKKYRSTLSSSDKASASSLSTEQKFAPTSFSQTTRHQWRKQQAGNAHILSVGRTAPSSATRPVVARSRRPRDATDSILTTSSVLDPHAPVFRSREPTTEHAASKDLSLNCSSSAMMTSTSPWRPSVTSLSGAIPRTYAASSSASTGVHSMSNGRPKWKQQRNNARHKDVHEARDRWLSKLRLWNDNVAETLGYLACGLCGELVHDNLECTGGSFESNGANTASACTQLYCASCLESSAFRMAHSSSFKCVRCHQVIAKESMTRNNFAQAQAASLGLSMSNLTSSKDSMRYSLEDLQQVFESSESRVSAVDLRVYHLVPGTDLGTLSNGQLEVLEHVHQQGLAQLVEQRLANARALERLRMEEWLKTQQDVLHFTPR